MYGTADGKEFLPKVDYHLLFGDTLDLVILTKKKSDANSAVEVCLRLKAI